MHSDGASADAGLHQPGPLGAQSHHPAAHRRPVEAAVFHALGDEQTPLPSQKISFTRPARFARNT